MKDLLKTNCFDVEETMIIFATVDKSPHCVQLHYVVKELENAINLENIKIENYVAADNKLIEIPLEVIGISKNFAKLKEKLER